MEMYIQHHFNKKNYNNNGFEKKKNQNEVDTKYFHKFKRNYKK